MRRITVLLALCLPVAAFGYGDTVWLRTYDPAASTGAAKFIAVGPDNNVISGGWYNGGGFQFVKYTPTGDTVWGARGDVKLIWSSEPGESRVGKLQPLGPGGGVFGAKVSFQPLGVSCQMSLFG